MANKATTHDSTVYEVSGCDSGHIYLPADAQRELGVAIGDMLSVTLAGLDHEFIDQVSFENPQTAGDLITVPAKLMRQADIDDGESVTATFDLAEPAESEAVIEADEAGEPEPESEATAVEEADEETESLADLFA